MSDRRDQIPGSAPVRPERKAGLRSIPPMVFVIVIAVAISIGYQVWHLTQPAFPLDLNSARLEHLAALPGIDEATAQKIVAGRPYKRKDELVRRQILDEAQYEQVKEEIVARQK